MVITRPLPPDERLRGRTFLRAVPITVPAPLLLTGVAFVVGGGVTAAIAFTDWFPSGYRNASLSSGLNTVDGCVALLVAYLSYGRFDRERKVRDGLIAHGLALLGLTAVVVPVVAGPLGLSTTGAWASTDLRMLGTSLIAAGALTGDHIIQRRPPLLLSMLLPLAGMLAVLLILGWASPVLPPAVIVHPSRLAEGVLGLRSHPAYVVAQATSAVALLVASLALARRAAARADELAVSMAPAFVLGTFAMAQYALFPTVYSDWLYSGDLLRTGCYLLLLIGAGAEIRRYWSAQTRAAVLEDRRRLAREIHDGVVQEISYIRMESRSLPEHEGVERIVDACDRALDEARDAVHKLALSDHEPLDHLLERAAHDLSRRYRIDVVPRLEADPGADPDQRHALVRIVREAIANAARHGGARRVSVTLASTDAGWSLEIRDDGGGFDPAVAAETAGGYGLISMRERAAALPGRCVVESSPGRGTTVKVTW